MGLRTGSVCSHDGHTEPRERPCFGGSTFLPGAGKQIIPLFVTIPRVRRFGQSSPRCAPSGIPASPSLAMSDVPPVAEGLRQAPALCSLTMPPTFSITPHPGRSFNIQPLQSIVFPREQRQPPGSRYVPGSLGVSASKETPAPGLIQMTLSVPCLSLLRGTWGNRPLPHQEA